MVTAGINLHKTDYLKVSLKGGSPVKAGKERP
jgi:hypothetical protein